MSKRVLDSKYPVVVYNPTGVFDIGYFRSCHAAGATPVFDCEFLSDDETLAGLKTLGESGFVFGVRVNGSRSVIMNFLRDNFFTNLDCVVLHYDDGVPAAYSGSGIQSKIFLEVTEFHSHEQLSLIDPLAVIVRGFEAGGRASRITSFILMQWYLENTRYPVVVHGGVGFHTAAGIFSAGCSAIVLDSQLYLSDESPVSENFKKLLQTVEEGDSSFIGESMRYTFRFFSKLGTKITKDLKEEESHLAPKSDGRELLYRSISSKVSRLNDTSANPMQSLFYLGQDGVFAKLFAARSKSVGGMIGMLFKNIGECLSLVDEHDPMHEGTKLAREHDTKYPIIQGPMANISDNADFAKMVLDAGCLPFFAMGNLPKNLAEKIISDGHEKVPSFGCGLIGLATNVKNFEEHLQLLKKYNVHYSLIAAGNAAQANDLEANGVKCYLHCPSSQMLENAIKGGVKRFIFEGMEAGGHIGTLTSFVLWEVAMEKFLAQKSEALADQRIIFAGGVGTKVASEFVSGMASVLAAKGAAVGISVGTTYLLTKEIVETGAIKPLYQKLLIENDETTVIGATLGLSTRTVNGTYANRIIAKEYEMMREKVPLTDRKHYFEAQNVGSLLIAAKAFSPDFDKLKAEKVLEYIYFDEKEALDKGNFHTGESLAFYKEQFTIDTVHEIFFGLKQGLKRNLDRLETIYGGRNTINDEIAIVGMGCLYPDAPDTETYWKNIVDKRYSIREIDPARVNPDYYYNEDKKADDKAYTKIAGVIDYYEFDRKKYGYSEDEAAHMSLSQKIVLDAAMQAIADAGYPDGKGLPKERTAVIVGTCLTNELNSDLQLRQYYPEFVYHLDQIPEFKALSEEDKEKVLDHFKKGISKGRLPKLPDGVALNVESARIAKHLGVEGINFTIDAACATSFAAIDAALKELLSGDSDVAVVGGVNTNHSPEAFVGFCKMGALSSTGSYPFDERAGGFVLGEGAGVVVLKRMKDAVADGNKIYGVIKGVGASSDGKGRFIAAPSAEGQTYAIKRAYENMRAPITPDDVDYIEAHGTSTIAGDGTEIETIKGVYTGPRPKGVSSVKSQVGHLLGGAGNAGLIKVLLAIQNKTLPPNGQFKTLSPKLKLDGTPLYVIKDAAEWKVEQGRKRRAAVSSYGFGGINYHLVIEEYDGNYSKLPRMIFSNPDYDPNDDRIVITAVGTVLPGAQNADAFWANLESGKVTISEPGAARFHNEYYAKEKDKAFNLPMFRMGIAKDYAVNGLKYKIPPSAGKVIDRSQFFSLDAASQVIDEAKLAGDLTNGNRIALIFGTTASEKNCEQIVRTRVPFMEDVLMHAPLDDSTRKAIAGKFAESIRAAYHKNTEDTIPGLLANITTGRVANFFNMNGANFIVDAECASSAVALSLAVKDLRAGTSDYIIAGGVDTNLTPGVMQAFHLLKVLSRGEAKVYDKDSTGLCMSEGAALLGLTTLKYAKAKGMKIYGEITDFAFRSFPIENMIAPTEAGFIRTFNDLYAKAPVSRSQIRYVDGFASSNKVVDKWELTALNKSFKKGTFLGNVKPEIGYYRGANPAVVIAKLVLMAKNRTILPMNCYNAETSMLDGKGNIIAATSRINLGKNEPLAFAVDISGLGGIHGHGVIRTIPAWLEGAASGSVRASAFATLEVKSSASASPVPAAAKGARICALLSGQGAQFPGMMKSLYESNPTVKKVFDKGEEIFRKERGYSILEMMFGNDQKLNSTENTQIAVFLSTAALHDVLAEKGIVPEMYIGHSVGEYSALYCSGTLAFDTALKLIIERSAIMKKTADEKKGSIMVVFADAAVTADMLSKSGVSGVWIANKNSGKQTAVSGSSEGIDSFAEFLREQKISSSKLNLSGAFHSPLFADASAGVGAYMSAIPFNGTNFNRVISNVNARRYPSDEKAVKELLSKQVSSPVEFVESVKYAVSEGIECFVEIGPNKLLSNLLRDIPVGNAKVVPTVDPKAGEAASLEKALATLASLTAAASPSAGATSPSLNVTAPAGAAIPASSAQNRYVASGDFNDFLEKNREAVTALLYAEYEKHKRERENEYFKRAGFYGGKVVISGAAIGLPGRMNDVFDPKNFERLLSGMNLIEPIDEVIKQKIVDKNIVRVSKDPQGNAKFLEINSTEDVIQLAGQLGYFNPKDYGIEFENDQTYDLGVAAGIEALRDAKIPLVQQYEKTSVGTSIAKGYALPHEMQERTGVIYTAVFSGLDTIIDELERAAGDKFYRAAYAEFEKIFQFLMANVKEDSTKHAVTEWFMKVREITGTPEKYVFNRNFLFQILSMGNAYLAQQIRAKGPNSQTNAACASITQACGIASDWIRTGRCDRVIVIAGEAATSNTALPLLGAGFLALGAATVKKIVSEAAKPFDADRNGMIVGSGAVGLVIEREDSVNDRGFNGQAEILGVHIKNSAFHGSRLDVKHISTEMKSFVEQMEYLHDLKKSDYASKLVFMSHETYTPARGGSADAEVFALKAAFPDDYRKIVITNTKGYTGHTLSAGIEDPVLVKSLQCGIAAPIANLSKIQESFADLHFSRGEKGDYQYGMHFAAGFGSQFAILFIRRIEENKVEGNDNYRKWLCRISGTESPEIGTVNRALAVTNAVNAATEPSISKTPVKAATAAVSAQPAAKSSVGGASLVKGIKALIAEMTGYGEEMLDENLDLEGDLGIDTVKQVEIFGKICEKHGIAVPEDLKLSEFNTIAKLAAFMAEKTGVSDAPAAAVSSSAGTSGAGSAKVTADIKKIIAEMTGYGEEMLDENLDLEGDLGIDTVKQVEIFGKICEKFGIGVPEDLKLTEFNTISKLSGFISTAAGISDAPAASASPASSASTSGSTADGGAFVKDVTRIIAEMTGYGEDMLDPNLDLEGDLGIDTVKQVEIFGKVCEHYGVSVPEDLKLSELNTIAKLAAFIANLKNGGPTPPTGGGSGTPSDKGSAQKDDSIKRFVVRPEKADLPKGDTNLFSGKKVLITSDTKGVAKKIGEMITARGAAVTLLGKDDVDFSDVKAVQAKAEALAANGVDGLIHLMPLDGYYNGKNTDKKTTDSSVKSLFALLKALQGSLNKNGAFVATVTFDSVIFPYTDPKADIYPVFGALSGMLKSVNKEFAKTLVKAVDFSSDYSGKIDEVADIFVKELVSGDTKVETGYRNNERFRITIVEEKVSGSESFVKEGDTVLLSGGARGITFEILKEMVKTYKVNPVILARSPIDTVDPEFLKDGVDEKAVFNSLAAKMTGAKPLEIKKAAAKAMNQVDTIKNIRALESLGVTVKYHAVDVTDGAAVKKIVVQYEKIDGVIHAAGVEESQLIAKKDYSTFNTVFDTKIDGARSLIAALSSKKYRYFMAFSSVAARFGNDGQTDYSAANEMLARMLQAEKRAHADRVYKIYDWTAWGEVGMATKESVMKFLASQGVKLMPVRTGIEFFMNDLRDVKDDEVVITNIVAGFDRDGIISMKTSGEGSSSAPFLGKVIEEREGYRKFSRVLDVKNDIFLLDHARDGVPLFLGATGVETMAEAARSVMDSGKVLVEMRDFTIPYGIKILQGKPKEIVIEAKKVSENEVECSIISVFMKDGKPMGEPTLHYKGVYRFADAALPAEKAEIPALRKLEWDGNLSELLYHPKRLFMHGNFDSIKDITGADESGVVALIHNTHKGPFFAHIPSPEFISDPVVVDGAFQVCGFVEFINGTDAILPYRIKSMKFFRPMDTHGEYLCITRLTGRDDAEKTRFFNVDLVDRSGNLFFRIEGFHMIAVEKVSPENSVANKFRMV